MGSLFSYADSTSSSALSECPCPWAHIETVLKSGLTRSIAGHPFAQFAGPARGRPASGPVAWRRSAGHLTGRAIARTDRHAHRWSRDPPAGAATRPARTAIAHQAGP